MLDMFFYEAFKEEVVILKKYLPAELNVDFTPKTIQEHGGKEVPAKMISIRTQSRIPDSWIEKISAILSRSTGFDHIKKYAKQTACGYLPSYSYRAVAEQTIMLCMSLMRKLPLQIKQFSNFDRDNLTGLECKGSKIVVVGVGKIGYEICKIAKGLEMEVFGVDVVESQPDINYVSTEEGIKTADVLVCAMGLTEKTYHYFNYELLKKAKKGIIFLNVGRGELSSSIDLLKLVDEGHLGGVGLDVFDNEALLGESLRTGVIKDDDEVKATLELHKKENVILTPHNSFNTDKALDLKCSQSVKQVEHFLEKDQFLWEVPGY